MGTSSRDNKSIYILLYSTIRGSESARTLQRRLFSAPSRDRRFTRILSLSRAPESIHRKRIYRTPRVTRRHPITDHRKPICLGSKRA